MNVTTQLRLNRNSANRQAIAVVELALVLPLLFLLTFGILEICEGLYLRQKVVIASHEGARIAVRRTATTSDVETAVSNYLDARDIHYTAIGSVVTCTPSPEEARMLEPIVVKVEVDVDANSRMPLSFYEYINGRSVTGEVTMFKEYDGINL